jgi:hypothetical protein
MMQFLSIYMTHSFQNATIKLSLQLRRKQLAMASAETGGDKYRSFIHGEGEKNTVWRLGAPPNFDVVNKLFEEERTNVLTSVSTEQNPSVYTNCYYCLIQNLVYD